MLAPLLSLTLQHNRFTLDPCGGIQYIYIEAGATIV
jgi:hypothetical protein